MQMNVWMLAGVMIFAAVGCKTTEPKKKTPVVDNSGVGNTDNTVVLGTRLTPIITSNQVVNGVLTIAAGQSLQVNFVVDGIPTSAEIGVGLSQRPNGSGIKDQGRYPTFIWPSTVESTTAYPVELIVRDVRECMRLGGQSNMCWLSEGDQIYTKDTRFDTAYAFQLQVGNNVDGTENTGVKAWWEKIKGFFSRDN